MVVHEQVCILFPPVPTVHCMAPFTIKYFEDDLLSGRQKSGEETHQKAQFF